MPQNEKKQAGKLLYWMTCLRRIPTAISTGTLGLQGLSPSQDVRIDSRNECRNRGISSYAPSFYITNGRPQCSVLSDQSIPAAHLTSPHLTCPPLTSPQPTSYPATQKAHRDSTKRAEGILLRLRIRYGTLHHYIISAPSTTPSYATMPASSSPSSNPYSSQPVACRKLAGVGKLPGAFRGGQS